MTRDPEQVPGQRAAPGVEPLAAQQHEERLLHHVIRCRGSAGVQRISIDGPLVGCVEPGERLFVAVPHGRNQRRLISHVHVINLLRLDGREVPAFAHDRARMTAFAKVATGC